MISVDEGLCKSCIHLRVTAYQNYTPIVSFYIPNTLSWNTQVNLNISLNHLRSYYKHTWKLTCPKLSLFFSFDIGHWWRGTSVLFETCSWIDCGSYYKNWRFKYWDIDQGHLEKRYHWLLHNLSFGIKLLQSLLLLHLKKFFSSFISLKNVVFSEFRYTWYFEICPK